MVETPTCLLSQAGPTHAGTLRFARADDRADKGQGREQIWPQPRGCSGYPGAKVMSDQYRVVLAQGCQQSHDIAHAVQNGVVLDPVRLTTLAEAANVRGDDPEPGLRQRANLVAPFEPGVGEAMQQDDQWPGPFIDIVDRKAVRLGHAVHEGGGIVHVAHSASGQC